MKRLSKIIAIILSLVLAVTPVACGSRSGDPTISTTEQPTDPLPEQWVLVNTEGMTPLQKAVVITAESYYLRGYYAQYDQGFRQYGICAPEDYTEQRVGYTDCAAFVYDVYFFSLGIDIGGSSATTQSYCSNPLNAVLYEEPIKNNFASMSGQEQASKIKEFADTLQPGDVIVYRNADYSTGHAMLYVGNGMMIHSSGSDSRTEENGTFLFDPIATSLLAPGHRNFILSKSVYVILRPLLTFQREIPAHTQQRMDLMRGVVAEKLCTHKQGQSVRPGEVMTFTFRITNRSDQNKTLSITDTVPKNTTYVSGAQTINENQLSWSVTVPAGGTTEVSYSVRVDPTAPPRSYIASLSEISGVPVNCPVVQVLGTYQQ